MSADADAEALRAWFDAEGLNRYAITGDESGEVIELARGPVVALGPGDEDFVQAPHPRANHWPGKPLSEMTMDDYNVFMFRWLEAAVSAGMVRCAHCGKRMLAGDDLPDPDTWDALFIEKELVAWMLAHFDCKRWLAKRLAPALRLLRLCLWGSGPTLAIALVESMIHRVEAPISLAGGPCGWGWLVR